MGRCGERFDPAGDSAVHIGDNATAVTVYLGIGMGEVTDRSDH
jgi:hypothetical protein